MTNVTDAAMRLDKQLCFALYACSREITKRYRPLLEPLGLTYTQYITMLTLWETDRMKVKELGAALHLDSGTLTPLLKKLETIGYVKRTRDVEDERNVWIEVTSEGRALQAVAAEIPSKIICDSGIDVEEAIRLQQQLSTLLQQLNPEG